ncbi:MAG: thiamine pyrophosphate-binding protein, partial [Chloroflexota bacterium]
MRDDHARVIADGLAEAGFEFVASLPASEVHTLQLACREDPRFTFASVTNEGEGISMCAGAWLGGKMPVMIMETSGVLLGVYSLVRQNLTFGIPVLLLSTHRGSLGEQHWYAVHTGAALSPVLSALRIPSVIVEDVEEVKS